VPPRFVPDELNEEPVLDAVEKLRDGDGAARAFAVEEPQLGNILERRADEMGRTIRRRPSRPEGR
jgi:hypothetical protein